MKSKEDIFRRILDAEHELPMPPEPLWCEAIEEVAAVALSTHPSAQRLLCEAAGEPAPPLPSIDALVRALAKTLLYFHPTEDFAQVEHAGRVGARVASRRKGAAAGADREVWKHALWAMYMRVLDPPSLQVFREEPLAEAIIEGIGAAGDLFDVLDGGTAEERLAEAIRLVRLRMLMVRYDVQVGGGGAIPGKEDMH